MVVSNKSKANSTRKSRFIQIASMASMQLKKDSNGEHLHGVQKATIVTVNNKGSRYIKLDRYHNRSGSPIDNQTPEIVPAQGVIKFTFLKGSNGSSGAFQYSGYTKSGVQCGLIVAWDAPSRYNSPDFPNRVFTYGSSKEFADENTLKVILENLAKASSTAPHANIVHQEPDTANLVVDVNMDNWF